MTEQKLSARRRGYAAVMKLLMAAATLLTGALVLFLIIYVLAKGLPNLSWQLVSTAPSYLKGTIGILPDILSTLYIVAATIVIVVPLGVGAAIYLTEYAENRKLVSLIERIRRRDPFRHSLYYLRPGWYAVLLPVF